MKTKQKTPGKLERATKPTPEALNTKSETPNKDNKIIFKNAHRQRVYELFLTGQKLTTVKATVELRIPDFRSHVRYIRKAGVTISDYYQNSGFTKYKVYFIHTGTATEPSDNSGDKDDKE